MCTWRLLVRQQQGRNGSGSNIAGNTAASKYDSLLAQAVRLGKKHEAKAKQYVPKMYSALVEIEMLTPPDAADRIYRDLAGIWQKDTIRRLLPLEAKNPHARAMQKQSIKSRSGAAAGLILQTDICEGQTGADGGEKPLAELEKENARLRKAVEELEKSKRLLLEKIVRLERALATPQRLVQQQQQQQSATGDKNKMMMTVVLPPHLFMKTFTLMRSSTRPLVFEVAAGGEVTEVEKMSMFGR